AAVEEARLQAVAAVHDERGIEGIEMMIGLVDEPAMLGQSFGASAVGEDNEERLVREHLASPHDRSRQFGRGFVVGRATSRGVAWIVRALQIHNLTAAQRAELLVCLPDRPEAWRLAEGDRTVDAAYWKVVHPYVRGSVEELEYATRKLINYGRSVAAVEL